MKNVNINIKQVHKQSQENLQPSQLVLEFSGPTVNCCLVNALRRLCLEHVPTYASCEKSITIDKNTSIYDNDYMRLRLSQLIIPDIQVNIPYLEDKYWRGVDYGDPNRTKHPDDSDMVELYVNVTNEGSTNLNVTTNHSKVFVNGETVNKFDKEYPVLLIQLKPQEIFSCRCVHVLGIGKLSALWSSGNIYYEEIDDNKYIMTLESFGQMEEYEMLYKSCMIIKEKVSLIRYKLKDFSTNEKYLSIELWDEDSTMGELINIYLQDHELVEFAGVKKPNLLIEMMVITYVTTAKDPLQPFHEILDLVETISDVLLEKFDKLGGKFITFEKRKKSKK